MYVLIKGGCPTAANTDALGERTPLRPDTLGGAGDPFDGAQPVVECAFGGLDQNMPDTDCGVGGETRDECAVVLAIPAAAQRNREFGLRPPFPQSANDGCRLVG